MIFRKSEIIGNEGCDINFFILIYFNFKIFYYFYSFNPRVNSKKECGIIEDTGMGLI